MADNSAPTGIDLDEAQPAGRRPIPRLLYVAGGLLAFVGVAVMSGLVIRSHKAAEIARTKVTEELASGPARSSRTAIEAQEPSMPAGQRPPLQSASEAYAEQPSGVSPFSPIPVSQQNVALSHPELAYQPVGTAQPPYGSTAVQPQLSPVEQAEQNARVKALQEEEAARTAPTTVKIAEESQVSGAAQPAISPSPSDVAELAALLRPNTSSAGPQNRERLEGDQAQKRAFADSKEKGGDDYLHASRTDPVSRFEIQQGARIPAALDEKVISDLPGEVTAVVRHDVMDSLTGKYVLIPAGSKLIGEYNSTVSYGQNRVQVVWTRVIFPDTSFLDLGRMSAHSAEGASGMHDQTDAHWKRTIAGVALTSLLSAGLQVSQNRSGNNSVLAYPSTGQVIAGAIGQQASQLGQELTQRNLNTQPTLKIRPGQQFFVFVKRDIVFDSPYEAKL